MMKESPLNRDEKTGGLSGLADGLSGIMPAPFAAPTNLAGVKMPERLVGIRLDGGRAEGLQLPALGDREVVASWRRELGGGPLYVRCVDRKQTLPVPQVQRLARVGELWLDCAVPDDEMALDLLVAGAHRLVLWPVSADDASPLLEALGDAAVIGWDGLTPWDALVATARQFGLPLLAAADAPAASGLDVYRVDLTATGRFDVRRVEAATPVPDEPKPDDAEDE